MDQNVKRKKLYMDTIKDIHLALRGTASYPEDHPISRGIIGKAYEDLANLFKKQDRVTISIDGNKLLMDDVRVDSKDTFSIKFAMDLDQRRIDSITFYRGLSLKDLMIFLNAMIKRPDVLGQNGGVASILQQNGVSTIKLNEVKYRRISEESKGLEDSHITDYLSGKSDTLGDYGNNLVHILENDPHRISDLITNVAQAGDITVDPYNQAARAEVMVETMNRVATELLGKQGVKRDQFRDNMTAILSTCEEDMLIQLSKAMEITEGERDEIVDGLVGEFFYDVMAEICVDGYRQNGQFDAEFVEGLIPSVEERKKLLPHLERKLRRFGIPDDEKIVGDLFGKEPEIKEEKIRDYHQGDLKKTRDEVTRLLAEGKGDEVQSIVRDLYKRLDDISWKIRKQGAEGLLDITSVLDEFDRLKENFRELSETLIKRVKKESHIDIYLTVSENLHKICTSQNRPDRYLINETIGRRLFDANKLSKSQLQKTLMARKKNGRSIQYNLGALDFVDEVVLTHILAQQHNGCPTVHLSKMKHIPENVLKALPAKFIKSNLILPFRLDSGYLYAATMNPNDLDVLNDIGFISGYPVAPHLAAEYYLLNAIEKFYRIDAITPAWSPVMEEIQKEDDLESIEGKEEEIPATEELKESDGPVVRLVNMILKEAIAQKASDIHIEPYENELRVRFRIDGTLTTLLTPSIRYKNVIASRIKIMSGLDISEKRLPQDGRFKIKAKESYVDVRVSTFPGIFGEKVVLRLLDRSSLILDINNLGLDSDDLTSVLTALHKSKGMILVTGPTGSGKTTTLYSMLHGLNDGSRNISTAEDPIEYNLKGINQFQMNPKIGLDFAHALRTILRQDPDIIMVGEIRDLQTAEIAVKAALTGHLVLSTLHTNSAPETITRLMDIGIRPYLITSSINLIVAQRLMRVICERCKVEASPNDLQLKLLESLGLDISGHQLFRGEGCEECNNTGYKGRIAIYEVMELWDEIQELISKGESSLAIKEKARDLRLVPLQERGFKKAIEGITDLDEWMRAVT